MSAAIPASEPAKALINVKFDQQSVPSAPDVTMPVATTIENGVQQAKNGSSHLSSNAAGEMQQHHKSSKSSRHKVR